MPTPQRAAFARKRIAALEKKQENALNQIVAAATRKDQVAVEQWRKVDRSCYTSIRRWNRILEGKDP